MNDNPQGQLFEAETPATKPTADLFAEIVFDRPLDQAYSYAVPENLREAVAVGKRVVAPFGRGDRQTTGFCVHLSPTGPQRAVKEIVRVLMPSRCWTNICCV